MKIKYIVVVAVVFYLLFCLSCKENTVITEEKQNSNTLNGSKVSLKIGDESHLEHKNKNVSLNNLEKEILDSIQKEKLDFLFEMINENATFLTPRGRYNIQKKIDKQEFMDKKGIFYQVFFDKESLRQNYQINDKMFDIKTALQILPTIVCQGEDERKGTIFRQIHTIPNDDSYYQFTLRCEKSNPCKIVFVELIGSEPNLNEEEKEIIYSITEKKPEILVKYFMHSRVIYNYLGTELPETFAYVYEVDKQTNNRYEDFANKQGEFYKILYDPKIEGCYNTIKNYTKVSITENYQPNYPIQYSKFLTFRNMKYNCSIYFRLNDKRYEIDYFEISYN